MFTVPKGPLWMCPLTMHRQVFLVINVGACTDYFKQREMRRQLQEMKEGNKVEVHRGGGEPKKISPEDVVVGDIVCLKIGVVSAHFSDPVSGV